MYTHSPLNRDRREIRLVRLRPPSNADLITAPVSLEIRHVSLDDDVLYAALSYVWGDAADTVPIDIDGAPFRVTRNLHAALQQFARDGVDSWLWVDAVCIAQADLAEKSWQIDAMRDVFGGAVMVYMWLGPGTEESDTIMEFISRAAAWRGIDGMVKLLGQGHVRTVREIASHVASRFSPWGEPKMPSPETETETETGTETVLRPIDSQDTSALANRGRSESPLLNDTQTSETKLAVYELLRDFLSHRNPPLFDAICNLLQRDYWHRVWIIQEVSLARDARVVVGTKTIPLDIFDAVFNALWFSLYNVKMNLATRRIFRTGVHNLSNITSLRIRNLRRKGSTVRLVDILWNVSAAVYRPHYSASDPRDIAFGLLGVMDDEERGGLQTDYSLSTEEVFARITTALLDHSGSRDSEPRDSDSRDSDFYLDSILPGDENGILPTWVPDWVDVGQYGQDVLAVSYYKSFCAAGERVQRQTFSEAAGRKGGLSYIVLSGCCVDEVVQVMEAPAWPQGRRYRPPGKGDAELWCQCVIAFTGLHPVGSGGNNEEKEGEAAAAAAHVFQTLVHGESGNFAEELNRLGPDIVRMRRVDPAALTSQGAAMVRRYTQARAEEQLEPQAPVDDEEMKSYMRGWRENVYLQNRKRTLFKTAKGTLGVGRVGIKAGDMLTLIWGARSPIVLSRRSRGGFYFRGDAYVDGLMHGEFLKTKPREEEFTLY
ncbi:Heterokaryon incompatibility protein [Colletotrichum higginsianum IMI 349063]|uniref:Heterokaryon incompatibility protein n=2 Tax=Colletotrichum higginsianum TaxID=80884 RepID=A0A1B7XRL4_COLHI|nr:Heterokaryon incompatibility protein [Colletotrichum higginsianum IMI 349063]OBR02399.1 Heterokaryon incompatibility protein [Colletotrichum higginsianum IMI 349063]TID07648.1 Heterokaryon incompatibility protein 6, OR allele [Colletotrichum higginsianum]GJD00381.1 heterokaryon incompatibility protein [Colletotrichum higginsianum]